jgi:hypothetical protein
MKKAIKVIGIIIVGMIILANIGGGDSENTEAQNSRRQLKELLTKNAVENSVYPKTVEMQYYTFTALAGDVGSATYTFTAENALGMPIKFTSKVMVVVNDDLTIKKAYDLEIIK